MKPQDVIDLTVTAVESGDYGSLIYSLSDADPTIVPEGVRVGTPPAASERIGLALLSKHSVIVKDIYGDGEYANVELSKLRAAVKELAERRSITVDAWLEQHDVNDADAAFQLAAFGTIIYG